MFSLKCEITLIFIVSYHIVSYFFVTVKNSVPPGNAEYAPDGNADNSLPIS